MKNLTVLFEKYGITLSKKQGELFDLFFNLLIETNKFLNLTAITEENEVAVKHFLDSCVAEKFFDKNASVVDVGAGAGFPSIPLKITRPDLSITMVDSLLKRVNFLNEVIEKEGFEKISACHSRAEDFCKNNRENFDIATARAVAPLNTLVEYLLPLVKVGGKAIIYKASKLDEELEEAKNAIKILGGKVEKIETIKIDECEGERKILIIKKIEQTPKKYPRDKNKARLSPLK